MLGEPWLDAAAAGVIGLLFGSFLNVLIYRLPRMLERQWADEAAQWSTEQRGDGAAAPAGGPACERLNLFVPRSRCPACGHALRWRENIPVLSYLLLRARCSACGARIAARYPVVEIATAALFVFCIQRWGVSPAGLAWCGFGAALLALACIDLDTSYLPDDMTLPLLWAGLLLAAVRVIEVPLQAAVLGAAGGYLSLWLVYWGHRLLRGREGMGFGDFKLFAALGAWFGWQALLPIILMSSLIGALVGLALLLSRRLRRDEGIPFGPFLVGAALTALLFGPAHIMEQMLRLTGAVLGTPQSAF